MNSYSFFMILTRYFVLILLIIFYYAPVLSMCRNINFFVANVVMHFWRLDILQPARPSIHFIAEIRPPTHHQHTLPAFALKSDLLSSPLQSRSNHPVCPPTAQDRLLLVRNDPCNWLTVFSADSGCV